MFDFGASPLPVPSDLAAAMRAVWNRIAAPGTWWSGTQRVALAHLARTAYGNGGNSAQADLPAPAVAAASLIAAEPAAVSEQLIVGWEQAGLDALRYVELVNVVAQVTAIDTFHRAIGVPLEPLPTPGSGEPSRQPAEYPVAKRRAWVPMIGPPSIPISLSAVPDEMESLEALHGALYLRYAEMEDPAVRRGLSRVEMELVGARTSTINECFF